MKIRYMRILRKRESHSMYNQLPGEFPERPRTEKHPRWLLLPVALCVAGFMVVHYAPWVAERINRSQAFSHPAVSLPSAQANAPPHSEGGPAITLPAADGEDLLRHLKSALAAQKEAAAELRRSQDWINRALPSPDDDSLAGTRLRIASSAAKAAEARINHSCEEIEIAERILIERSKEP
jgi:hypothetical protein